VSWRRETKALLAWLAITIGALVIVATLGTWQLQVCEAGPHENEQAFWCGFGVLVGMIIWIGVVLLVGGIGLLLLAVLWFRSRRIAGRCTGCRTPVTPADATCPACGRSLAGVLGPPPGWGASRRP
jgi:hypothetical protein